MLYNSPERCEYWENNICILYFNKNSIQKICINWYTIINNIIFHIHITYTIISICTCIYAMYKNIIKMCYYLFLYWFSGYIYVYKCGYIIYVLYAYNYCSTYHSLVLYQHLFEIVINPGNKIITTHRLTLTYRIVFRVLHCGRNKNCESWAIPELTEKPVAWLESSLFSRSLVSKHCTLRPRCKPWLRTDGHAT